MIAKKMHLHSPFPSPPITSSKQEAWPPALAQRHLYRAPGKRQVSATASAPAAGCISADREKRGFPEGAYRCAHCTHVQMYTIHTSLQLHSNVTFHLGIHPRNYRPLPDIHHNLFIKQCLADHSSPCAASEHPSPLCTSPVHHIPPESWEQTHYPADNDDSRRPRLGGNERPYTFAIWKCLHMCLPIDLYPYYCTLTHRASSTGLWQAYFSCTDPYLKLQRAAKAKQWCNAVKTRAHCL